MIDSGNVLAELTPYVAVGAVLLFAFVNGFHDGGNVIASVVCSRSMSPVKALVLASLAEFVGPLLLGTAVAHTIATRIFLPGPLGAVDASHVYLIVMSGVIGAVAWKLPCWAIGLPSSGSHALIGGLVGAGLVEMGYAGVNVDGVLYGVVAPMLLAPVIGFVGGALGFNLIRSFFAGAHRSIGALFVAAQKPGMVILAAGHGSNDAQKSMGLIVIVLAAQHGPDAAGGDIPYWVMVSCSAALALGLLTGGWRIVRTVGFGICRIEAVHSFAGQASAMGVLVCASLLGGPVSATQVIASSVAGVGAARRLSGVRWTAVGEILYAWALTIPVTACIGALLCKVLHGVIIN
jgi:inorganic phosphate transporter, PiT family